MQPPARGSHRLASKPPAEDSECRGRIPASLSVCTLSFEAPQQGRPHADASSRPAARRARPQGRLVGRPVTPPPVAGRCHGNCQTDAAILEALALPPEASVSTQTDAVAKGPPARLPPVVTGADACTQVTPAELFDFERDVGPVVQNMVQQALQAAVVEASEGLRLEALRRRRRELEEAQYRETAALQRLEQDARRRASQLEARQRQAEELAAIKARQSPLAFELVGQDVLEREALAMVNTELSRMTETALQAACGSGSSGGPDVKHHQLQQGGQGSSSARGTWSPEPPE